MSFSFFFFTCVVRFQYFEHNRMPSEFPTRTVVSNVRVLLRPVKNHCLRASWRDLSRALKNTFPGNPVDYDKRGEHHINGDCPPVWQEVFDLVDVVDKHHPVVHIRRVHHRCEARSHKIVSLDSVNDSLQYLSDRIMRDFLYLVDVAHRNLPQQVN